MLRLQRTLTVLRTFPETTFHHLLVTGNWILQYLSWPVVGWITAVVFAFGGLMVRADEFTPATILFSLGHIFLFVKFMTWTEVRDNLVAQGAMLVLFAALILGGSIFSMTQWIKGLRPVPPSVVAALEPERPNRRLLRLFNSKTTLQGVRIKIMEHMQRHDDQSLQEQFGTAYRDIELVQPYTVIPIGTIELAQGPEDVFQVNAITPIGKFTYMLYFRKKSDNTWEEEYIALHMGGEIIMKRP